MSAPTSSPGSCAPIRAWCRWRRPTSATSRAAQIPEPIDLIVCDASFIGLRTALPAALALAAPGAHLVALIKPQFEVGKGRVGKGGIVREPELHQEVVRHDLAWLPAQPGWRVLGITESPITGAEGNKEFLIAGVFSGQPSTP